MTSGASPGHPGGAPQRFGYREWPAPSSSGGSSSPDLPGDSSIESSCVGGRPQTYEMSDRGSSSRASTAPSADQSRPNPVSGARPPSPASSSLGQWPPSPSVALPAFRAIIILVIVVQLQRRVYWSAHSPDPSVGAAGCSAARGPVSLPAAASDVFPVRFA